MKKKQAKVKKSEVSNGILKAVIVGPAILIVTAIVLYCGWWGVSKLFYTIHNWTTGSFLPWMGENWYIILIVWGLIILASVAFHYISSAKFKPMPIPKEVNSEEQLPQNI